MHTLQTWTSCLLWRRRSRCFCCCCCCLVTDPLNLLYTLDSALYERKKTTGQTRRLPWLGVHHNASVLGIQFHSETTIPRHCWLPYEQVLKHVFFCLTCLTQWLISYTLRQLKATRLAGRPPTGNCQHHNKWCCGSNTHPRKLTWGGGGDQSNELAESTCKQPWYPQNTWHR